ncbi:MULTISPECIES: hypothetical protein [unclassified Methylobacterium]|uniref:hypothetical protein n=1 Tax=unclassified Methylobacterium TaxID=2615210 RepID=UPI0011C1F7FF|nr:MULTISPECIES: hypothetical protein [unclassified Methylobacterium]QEE39840.1 hypothetical protein FVA80_13630 [Methylobacterium sp. WL1]TXN57316.1 hypothetical protein FV241_11680 [Methylobacterium sp. WL2]
MSDPSNTSHRHPAPYAPFQDAPQVVTADTQFGEVIRRLFQMRALGEGAFTRAIQAVLVTLGRSALEEAELQAAVPTMRAAPDASGVRVTPWGLRRRHDPSDPSDRSA